MRAMVLKTCAPIETAPLHLLDIPKPKPAKKQLLVKVNVCGVCRTDLHVVEGELNAPTLPIIPGHQIVGRVESLGEGSHKFKIGDRVGIAWLWHTCGQCNFCTRGDENLCKRSIYTGYQQNGGYAEYAVVPEDYAYALPSHVSDEETAPLLCAGIVGYRAYKRCRLPSEGRLGIYGFGSSAHLMLQVALTGGYEVFVSTRNPHHQALAKKMGASWVGEGETIFPKLMDSIIIFAPSGDLVPYALKSLISGGTAVLAGIHMSNIPSMDYEDCLFHEKNLRSVESNTREDGIEFLNLAEKISIKPLITIFPLEKANQALQSVKQDAVQGTAILQVSR